MLRRAWYLLLLIVAAVATVVQVDRHAHEVPAYAAFVPHRFANFSLIGTAAQEAENGPPKKAVADARRVVSMHPIQAESLTLLAVAELRNHNQDLGSRALLLAAQRGWREPLAQRAVAIAAAQSGEWDVAADRLAALWKASSDGPDLRELSASLLQQPEMQAHFATRLVDDKEGVWTDGFVRWATDNLEPAVFVNTVTRANRAGARFDCAMMTKSTRKLLRQGWLSLAKQLWHSQCGAGQSSAMNDFAFVEPSLDPDAIEDPFAWQYPEGVGLTLDFPGRSTGAGLDFENTEPLRQLLAQKYVALAPGSHVIRVTAERFDSASRPMLVQFSCAGDEGRKVFQPIAADSRKGPITVDIPASGCSVQTINLRVAKGRGKDVRIAVD